MNKHFIAYHSRAVRGEPYGDGDGTIRFFASKRKRKILQQACGNTVWVIEGVPGDGGTAYSLCGVYQPERVEDSDSGDLIITGGNGKGFHPPIPLNRIPWFSGLLHKFANFSRGFSEMKEEEFIDGFTSISRSHSKNLLSFDRFRDFLKSDSLSEKESSFLSLMVSSEPDGLSSVDAAVMLGYRNGHNNLIVANGIIARIGGKFLNFIGAKRPRTLAPHQVISDPNLNHRDSRGFYRWRARRGIVDAFCALNGTSFTSWQPSITFHEGSSAMRLHIVYERDPVARRRCLQAKGYTCEVCEFNFEDEYGEIGRSYVEVHHTKPLSKGKRTYSNIHDELIVVCSNCHSMIHRRKEPYSPDEIRNMLRHTDGG